MNRLYSSALPHRVYLLARPSFVQETRCVQPMAMPVHVRSLYLSSPALNRLYSTLPSSSPSPAPGSSPSSVGPDYSSGSTPLAKANANDGKVVTPEKKQGFIAKSKAMLKTYVAGFKQVWANRKLAAELRRSKDASEWTREEFQLVCKSDSDTRKLIPFAILLAILPEAIPFVAVIPGALPSTCVTPEQLVKQRQKMHAKRLVMTENLLKSVQKLGGFGKEDFGSVENVVRLARRYPLDFELRNLDRKRLSAFCKFLGLNSYGTHSMLKTRLERHFDYLHKDDQLIKREGIQSLSLPALELANEERGMRSVEVGEEHLRRALDFWISLHLRDQEPLIPPGLLILSRIVMLEANYLRK
ncbi:uncharacterized protein VTP21DRAFT_3897 [Calcarisporiella thermophila]|uniref:uncharacterized protein n=1 Tax=Calcarisporiella thermophila TaxID=911321 RepID=UPI00374274F0